MKKKSLIDTPVLLMLFVRPEQLLKSFNAVKLARPSKLFLLSDGPRKNYDSDKELNDKCKEIVEDINWECEVYHKYSKLNQGMYITAYEGFKWCFSFVDRVIFLEDDIVANQSFFKFCDELLEKYKNDLRIHSICGMNHVGQYDGPASDYFFSKQGSIWGFALWKRTFDSFEYNLNFTQDKYSFNLFLNSIPKNNRRSIKSNIILKRKNWEENNELGDFELISFAAFHLQNGLRIIPKNNMISCHGISENSGHSVNNKLKLPKSIRSLFFMKTYEISFPIKHPNYVIGDSKYDELVLKYMGVNNVIRFFRKVETKLRGYIFLLLNK